MIQALFSRTMMLGMVLLALGIAGCTDELEEQLAAAQAERAKAEAAMSTVQAELAQAKDDAEKKFVEMEALRAKFKEVEDLEQVSSELATLKPELDRVRSELDTLRAEVAKQHQLLSEQAVVYRTKSRSKVRAGPTTDSAEVAVVPKGNSIQVYEIVEGGTWYKVGGMGYIFHELLEPVK